MVETIKKRDIISDSRIAYIGDDTGLIKKVKMIAKRIETTRTVEYDTKNKRRKTTEDDKPKTWEYVRPNKLGPQDNQSVSKHETDISFKLLTKFGA